MCDFFPLKYRSFKINIFEAKCVSESFRKSFFIHHDLKLFYKKCKYYFLLILSYYLVKISYVYFFIFIHFFFLMTVQTPIYRAIIHSYGFDCTETVINDLILLRGGLNKIHLCRLNGSFV